MGIPGWLATNWFGLLQTMSLLVGIFSAVHAIRDNTRERKIENQERKVANLFALTAAHRELWMAFYQNPAFHRVRDPNVDLEKNPPTLAESGFVHELILHFRTSYHARKNGMEFDDDAVTADIRQFFAKPIPQWVWEKSKVFQGRNFVVFVEACFEPTSGGKVVV